MFCPKCRGEFREGYTHCRKCDADLVDVLPPLDEEAIKKSKLFYKITSLSIESWLRIGGFALIIISILSDLFNTIGTIYQYSKFGHPDTQNILISIFGFIYSIIKDSMWGLFYIALGYIIRLLKQGTFHEK